MKTYNWEGVNPDGYFVDKLEPIPSALPDRKSGSAGMPRPISDAIQIYTLSVHDALPIYDTSLNSRFKSLDTLKVKIISVTFRRVIRTNHKKASKIWRHENIQLGGCQS